MRGGCTPPPWWRKFLAASAAVALAACGTRGGASGQTRTCTLTLEGDLAGSYDCRPATTFYSKATNTSGFAFSVQQSSTVPGVTLAIGFPGSPPVNSVPLTYRSTDPGAEGGIQLTLSNRTWSAVIGNGPPFGSYAITFTALDSPTDVTTGTAFTATGSLDATLPANPGSGSVVMRVTF